jgi:hypothetical protein
MPSPFSSQTFFDLAVILGHTDIVSLKENEAKIVLATKNQTITVVFNII